MACDTRIPQGVTKAQRLAQIKVAVARLEAALAAGTATVNIGPLGSIVFNGWNNRDGVADACAFHALSVKGSFALKRSLATAEARSGRKVNAAAIAAGIHSHDGGSTWSTH